MTTIDLDWTARPSTLFAAICRHPGALWLDDASFVRPSLMACRPQAQLIVARDGSVRRRDRGSLSELTGEPIHAISDFLGAGPGETRGWTAGFLAFDLAALVESRFRPRASPDASTPLAYLARYDAVLFGEPVPRLRAGPTSDPPLRWSIHATDAAVAEELMASLAHVGAMTEPAPSPSHPVLLEAPEREDHERAVSRALAYIAAGDIYQVNLAGRFRVASRLPPPQAYLRMRARQPVPHGAYLDTGELCVLLNSPERFLRLEAGRLETSPIKGTRPRGASPGADLAWIRDLSGDPKERAEHVMIVDLERNDLGRVCVPGSVDVPRFAEVETYATLHHLVSTVRGTLRPGTDLGDVLRATFPGGSITGAPKIRATEVITELESQPRELYTGAFVRNDPSGTFDSAIAIRVAVWRDGVYTYHAGGGIVADSNPAREFEECLLKAKPFLGAVLGPAEEAGDRAGLPWPGER